MDSREDVRCTVLKFDGGAAGRLLISPSNAFVSRMLYVIIILVLYEQ